MEKLNMSLCCSCVIIIIQRVSRRRRSPVLILNSTFSSRLDVRTRARCRRETSGNATQRASMLKPSHISSFRMCCSVWNTFTQAALCLPPRSPMHGNWQEHVNMGSFVTCQRDCARWGTAAAPSQADVFFFAVFVLSHGYCRRTLGWILLEMSNSGTVVWIRKCQEIQHQHCN